MYLQVSIDDVSVPASVDERRECTFKCRLTRDVYLQVLAKDVCVPLTVDQRRVYYLQVSMEVEYVDVRRVCTCKCPSTTFSNVSELDSSSVDRLRPSTSSVYLQLGCKCLLHVSIDDVCVAASVD